MRMLYASAIALFLLPWSAVAATCPAIVTPREVKFTRPPMPVLPQRDRIPFPDVAAGVSCMIGSQGRLSRCTSTLADERGPALAAYVSRWRILSRHAGVCSVRGRQFAVQFHLRNVS